MNRTDLVRKLAEIVRKERPIPEDTLTLETPLSEAGIDSLDSLTILFAIEEELRISIPDATARAIRTFGDMVDAAAAQLSIEN